METMANEKELTLKDIFNIIKKGWVRIIVYILVAALIASAVLVTIYTSNKQVEYTTNVRFNNSNLASGVSEWGTDFDYSSIVKSVEVVNAALEECGYEGEKLDELSKWVTKNIKVVANEEKNDLGEIIVNNGNLNIVLKKSKELRLTDSDYKAIVDEIARQSITYIRNKYSYKIDFANVSSLDYTSTNYVKAYEILYKEYVQLNSILDSILSIDSSFRSTQTKQSFQDIKNRINFVSSDINSLVSYFTQNAVKNTENQREDEVSYIDRKVAEYTVQIDNLESSITKLGTIIDSSKPIIIAGDNVIQFGLSNADYYDLIKQYKAMQDELIQLKTEKQTWETLQVSYSGVITTEASKQAYAKAMIDDIQTELSSIYDDMSIEVEEYNKEALLINAIKIETPAQKTSQSVLSASIIIILEFVIIVLAAIVAMVVANSKMKAKGSDNEGINNK